MSKPKQASTNDTRSTVTGTARKKVQIPPTAEIIAIDDDKPSSPLPPPYKSSSPEFILCDTPVKVKGKGGLEASTENGKEQKRLEANAVGKACNCNPTIVQEIVQEGMNVDDIEDELTCPM
jgi:hypothetical protein